MSFKQRIITILFCSLLVLQASAQKTAPIDFEKGTKGLVINKRRSRINTTTTESLRGESSLQWRWSPKATLSFKQDIGYAPISADATNKHISTFSFWLYNTKPNKDSLKVEFLKKGKVQCYFYFHLNYKGWRTGWVAFDRDMQGQPVEGMDQVRFAAPRSGEKGTFYIDEIITSTPIDPRHQMADHQVPFVNKNAVISANKHWMSLEYFSQMLNQFPVKKASTISSKEAEGLKTIEGKLNAMFLENAKNKKGIQKWIKDTRQELNISGKGRFVYFASYPVLYSSEKKPTKHLHFGLSLKNYTNLLLNIAQQYHLSNKQEDKDSLALLFVDMVKNMRKYGWAEGSGIGTLHHLGYSMRNYYPAMYLMKEELAKVGLREQVAKDMMWFSGYGKMVEPKDRYIGINVDVLNTTLMGQLSCCMMTSDDTSKVANMKALQEWLTYGVDYVPGLLAPFKPDGAFFHHYNHYPLYAKDALDGSTPVFYAISGTPFSLPEHNVSVVKNALLKMRLYSHNTVLPITMSGRHPLGHSKISAKPYYYMAKAGKGGETVEMDKELASIYLSLASADKKDDRRRIKEFEDLNITPEVIPSGNWSINYASINMHRKNDWLFTVKGFNTYLWGAEIYVKANAYGRYMSYGHYQLQRRIDGKEQTGFRFEGYDWNRLPGTTTIHLPIDELAGNVVQVDHLSGYEELLISDEKFGASLSMGTQGVYAMKLHEHDKYHGSHRATKSYFMFDDFIVMLGSDIENNVTNYETETTLFQNSIEVGTKAIDLNGKKIDQLGAVVTNDTKQALIIDNLSNGWYIPTDGQNLEVSYKKQDSKDPRNKKSNNGTFISAWLKHGKAPKNASYEYALLVGTDKDQLNQFAKEQKEHKNYVVAQKDSKAHIVKEVKSNTWGYAIFDNTDNKAFEGPLRHTNIPALAMIKEGKEKMEIEVCNPDLNLYQGKDFDQYNEDGSRHEVSIYSRLWANSESIPVKMTLSIKGQYKVEKAAHVLHQLIVNGNTEVTVILKDGMSKHITLLK